jgi:hypothetical protein
VFTPSLVAKRKEGRKKERKKTEHAYHIGIFLIKKKIMEHRTTPSMPIVLEFLKNYKKSWSPLEICGIVNGSRVCLWGPFPAILSTGRFSQIWLQVKYERKPF